MGWRDRGEEPEEMADVVPLRPDTEPAEPDHDEPVEAGDEEPDEPDGERLPAVREETTVQPLEGTVVRSWEPPPRRPIFASWIIDPDERRHAFRWFRLYVGYKAGFHSARSPLYLARLIVYAPRGAGRAVRSLVRWIFDAEGKPLRDHAVERGDIPGYMHLSRLRNDRVRLRIWVVGIGALATIAVLAVSAWASQALVNVELAALVAALGWYGRHRDRPFIPPAIITNPEAVRLTPDVVERALGALGISLINQAVAKGPGITFAAPIVQDGPGWRADVDLPYGVTAVDIIDKRRELASGLRRPLGCVWPEPADEEHAGRLVLWVGMNDLSKTKQPPWPLLTRGQVDLFEPFPFGTDQRGRSVHLTLMFASTVVGAVPRVGKTFAVRLILLAAALAVRAQIHAYDLKGTGDFGVLESVAHRYRAGDDEDDIEYAVDDMRALQAELRRRTKVIRGLPRDICRENKVTPELAGMASLRLHPIVIAVDECQRWFEHKTYGSELAEIGGDLVRRGPAVGIMVIFSTQRPDKDSLPTGIRANAVVRFCLKVTDQPANDMVLGTSAYRTGVRATVFSRKRDLGIGYLVGEEDDPRIVRTYYVDNPRAEQVVARARALREEAGTLSGHALGEVEEGPRVSLLEDVAAVAQEERVWSETICGRLAELRPELYGGWTPSQLADALKPYGVETGQVWGYTDAGEGANRRGVARADVLAALGRRGERGR